MNELAFHTITYAKKKGADRSKIALNHTVEKRLTVENKVFTLATTKETQKIDITLHREHKKGSASLNTDNEKAVQTCVDNALSLAEFSCPDTSLTMPDLSEANPASPLPFMWDERTSKVSLNELQEFAEAMLECLTKDKRVAIDRIEVSTSCKWRSLYNSSGVEQSERQTLLNWNIIGMAATESEVSGFDFDSKSTHSWEGALDKALHQCALFKERIIKNLNPIKPPSYKGIVLLTPRAVEKILLSSLQFHMAGSSVMDGKSLWGNKIGCQVASKLINLADDPHNKRFFGATSFDGDGLPTKPRILIKEGVLMTHLHDCYTAKRCQTQSTAMSSGPFGLICQSGTSNLKTMMNARPDMLVVDRFSGNIDPIKGDFSGVAKSSRYYKNGQDQGAVVETLIAGNVLEILNSILAVSSITEDIFGSMQMPWILVDGVTVTGSYTQTT